METRHADAVEAKRIRGGYRAGRPRRGAGRRASGRRGGRRRDPDGGSKLLDRLVEEEEDRIDAEEARKVLAGPNDETVPWEQVKKELRL